MPDDDGQSLVAHDDAALVGKYEAKTIDVLSNDVVHESESFDHTTNINVSGNSGVVFATLSPTYPLLYWFETFSGTGSVESVEDSVTSNITFAGFTFYEDLGPGFYTADSECSYPGEHDVGCRASGSLDRRNHHHNKCVR